MIQLQDIQNKLRKWNTGTLHFVYNLRDTEIVTRRWKHSGSGNKLQLLCIFRSPGGSSHIGITCASLITTAAAAPTWTLSWARWSARSGVPGWSSPGLRPGARGWGGEVSVTRRQRGSSLTSSHKDVSSLGPVLWSEEKITTLRQGRSVSGLVNTKSKIRF